MTQNSFNGWGREIFIFTFIISSEADETRGGRAQRRWTGEIIKSFLKRNVLVGLQISKSEIDRKEISSESLWSEEKRIFWLRVYGRFDFFFFLSFKPQEIFYSMHEFLRKMKHKFEVVKQIKIMKLKAFQTLQWLRKLSQRFIKYFYFMFSNRLEQVVVKKASKKRRPIKRWKANWSSYCDNSRNLVNKLRNSPSQLNYSELINNSQDLYRHYLRPEDFNFIQFLNQYLPCTQFNLLMILRHLNLQSFSSFTIYTMGQFVVEPSCSISYAISGYLPLRKACCFNRYLGNWV